MALPNMALPSKKVTLPVGAPDDPLTVAVKATVWPKTEGLGPALIVVVDRFKGEPTCKMSAFTDCPSGLVMVMVFDPALTPIVEMFNLMWVGSTKLTLFTVTPPETLADRRFLQGSPDMLEGVS